MEGARVVPGRDSSGRRAAPLSPAQAMQQIRKLEQEMYRLARNLEFEKAAQLRDEISALRHANLGADADRLAG
jgi:excinuclease ABC subunit B